MIEEMVEVKLADPATFLKVKETLTRIGVASKRDKTIYQSCHILHKQNKYYIVHFKELFALDGKETDFGDDDKGRRNTIANLLAEWNLVALVEPNKSKSPVTPIGQIKILAFKDKDDWKLVPKYSIGGIKTRKV
jgi:hypothetical protein